MLALPLRSSQPELYDKAWVAGMFASGEQGAWYEPSLTNGTLFQDAAGTTPVTALEQPVGLMLDQSKQGVGRNGSKRVNLLSYTEQFDNAAWMKAYSTISPNSTTAPNGYTTADAIHETADNAVHICYGVSLNIINVSAGVNVTSSIYIKPNGRTKGTFSVVKDSANYDGWNVFFDLANKSFTTVVNATGMATSTSITGPDQYGFYKITTSGTVGTSLKARNYLGLRDDAANDTYLGDITKGFYIWGADLRLASEAATLPAYQRIDADWSSTLPGNHATQSVSANRPVLSARYNLFTTTEGMSGFNTTTCSRVINAGTAPDGSNNASKFIPRSTSGSHGTYQTATLTLAIAGITLSVWAKAAGYNWLMVDPFINTDALCYFDLVNGTLGSMSAGCTGKITPHPTATGWYKCQVTRTVTPGTYSTLGAFFVCTGNGGHSFTGNGTDGVLLWGADWRFTDQSHLPYQRVDTATSYDADPIKFPAYLRFNGTNSWMLTGSINFTGTDKMTVVAGVRKVSNSSYAMLAEFSTSVNATLGAFNVFLNSLTYGYQGQVGINGARVYNESPPYAPPITNEVTINFDMAAVGVSQVKVRVDGVNVKNVTNIQGTGASGVFGTYPLFIGMRGGSTLPFNGNLYSLIIRGAATDAAHITHAEKFVAYKTGINI